MIRIFPDFSVQVSASASASAPGGGMVSGAANGSPQSAHGLPGYQQSDPYWERPANAGNCSAARPKTLHLAGGQQHTSSPWLQALRKEKSRDAARSRRGKENFEFYELAKMLPLPGAITSQLDKASIIRLTISYLKMRDFANQGDPPWNLRMEGPPPNTSVKVFGRVRICAEQGRPLPVHLGDRLHLPGTLAAESSSPSGLSPDGCLERSFFIRMKSTLTKRGVHIKSSGYKVIHVTGRLRIRMALTHSRSVPNQIMGMVVVAHALPPPTVNEVRIDCQMFVTRVNMDLKFVYCENRISDYMDMSAADVVGKRCYQLIHAEDAEVIRQSHVELMSKGQCVTNYYRWIQRSAGYIWIQSSATIAINTKNANDKNVIWVNYMLSNHEYKDTPIDLGQMPSLPEKNSESSESSDSDCASKENSDNEKAAGKLNQPERSEDAQAQNRRQQQRCSQSRCSSEQEAKRPEERDTSSNADSPDSNDSLDASDAEPDEPEDSGGAGMGGVLGGLHIKVEHYGEAEEDVQPSQSSSSEEEEEHDEEDGGAMVGGGMEKLQQRKRRKVQKWDRTRSRKLRLSSTTPSPAAATDGTPLLDAAQAADPNPSHLLVAGSPGGGTLSSVLKIKTEMSEPINFDNDSSIWNFPPNREISRNESPYSMTTAKPAIPAPLKQGGSLQVPIPDAVLTPPATEGGAGARKPPYNGSSTPSGLAPADPLSPPLSASPRDKQQGTPTTTSSSSSSSSSLLCSRDLEALQRLQSGNVVLPLVHRVAGTPAPTGSTPPRVYTTGTIRYAPADVTLAMAPGSLLPNASVNFVDAPGFGLDPKTPMEMLYHHVHRLNMSAAAATTGPFAASPVPSGGTGALAAQMPTAAANVFTTADAIFSTLPFPVYTNGIQAERKED
ncbi:neuronal PAS domain-containing protein 3 isoform X4 [Phyllopteryx taeniolatus]|uniref:neuronal PAS domain-containing protein 3 isoform X4 n=1 Tax=Phyllopteryx taeniolatus TaxID=161469 RepID=UPI002AD2EC82|nr:neuronal PAS domain-containing protein 3 isoform X4 [Phyllopteryx taeniolatus]